MSATIHDLITFPIELSYPEAKPLSLHLEFPAGRLVVKGGASAFVSGEAVYHDPDWQPQILTNGGNITIRQNNFQGSLGRWKHFKNEWTLAFGSLQPFTLYANTGAGQTQLALGGLPLNGLHLDCGAGQTLLGFDRPNPQPADLLKLGCGAGHLQIGQLLNANADLVKVDVGAGQADLNFTGETLTRDLHARISVGVGQVVLNVKRGLRVQVEAEQGLNFLSKLRVPNAFVRLDRVTYQSPHYTEATGARLTIQVDSAVGAIELNMV